MINNKRGIVKVIESAIAIVILLGFITFIVSNQVQAPDTSENVYKIQHQVLREVANNYTLRSALMSGSENETYNYIGKRLEPFPLLFSISVCNPNDYCGCKENECPSNREIYADEILISTNLSDYKETKLALFSWILPGLFQPKLEAPTGGGGGICGDGNIDSGEVCDDGNTNSCDGCKGDCSRADKVCGDGIIECGEGCDGAAAVQCWTYTGRLESTIVFKTTFAASICVKGSQSCTSCQWSACAGEVWPVVEGTSLCNNGLDDDCNGVADC